MKKAPDAKRTCIGGESSIEAERTRHASFLFLIYSMGIFGTQQKNADLVQKKLVEFCAYINPSNVRVVIDGIKNPRKTAGES